MKVPLIKSIYYALQGIYFAFGTERSLRLHAIAMCLTVAAGIYVGLTVVEWGLVSFAVGLVITAELFNTAVERLGDEASGGKYNHTVGRAKDIAAAAVLITALTALAIGIPIVIIPLFQKLF
jgi:diacylglycerol kinase (ATP)